MSGELLSFPPKEGSPTVLGVRAPNGVLIGDIYQEVDGYYVLIMNPERNGYITEQVLMELALKLSDLNYMWNDQIAREFKESQVSSLFSIEDDPFTNTRTGAPL